MPADKRNTEPRLPVELAEVERLLASFRPEPSRVDRDRLMFDAGAAHAGAIARDSVASPQDGAADWKWQAATVAALLVACVCGALYLQEHNRQPLVVREIVHVRSETPTPREAAVSPTTPAAKDIAANPLAEQAKSARPSSTSKAAGWSSPGIDSVIRLPFWPTILFAHRPGNNPLDYFALRQLVLTHGIEALPTRQYEDGFDTESADQPPPTVRNLMNETLPRPSRDKLKRTNGPAA